MPKTFSTMQPLGTPAPEFTLADVMSGRPLSLQDARGARGTLVMVICNHCPYVQHVLPELLRLASDYLPRGVAMLAISSNDAVRYPDDAPGPMRDLALRMGFPFPYLYDETQAVGKALDAGCTPDFLLYDSGLGLYYRGRLDASTPGNGLPLDGADLRQALDALVLGAAPPADQKPSMGCSIKWKA